LILNIAHLVEPCRGELVSGDAVLVRQEGDVTLLVVIDVLGHGPEAARVAALGIGFLETAPLRRAGDLLHGLHTALHGTRGAAVAICVIRDGRLDGCGVGNVEIRVLGSPVPTVLTPGIVGQRLHRLREFEGRLAIGDRLVCFSDGISSQVPLTELKGVPPRTACALVMQRHRRLHDDATILIADLGPSA
jgi:negative regulator of sigma-B (phosphoserine phosphatase)